MALSVPERIAQVAEHFAKHSSHGYSQPNRGTGSAEYVKLSDGSQVTVTSSDVDCSEMVRQCVNAALSGRYREPIAYLWTGDEDEKLRAQGFTRMAFSASKVRRGDVLLVGVGTPGAHTGIALGGGKQADAHGDEYGGITGPNRGDQTGHEVEVRDLRTSWTYIYRYTGGGEQVPPFVACSFTFTAAAECNVRSAPTTADKANVTGQLKPGERVYCDGIVPANGHIWGTYIANSGKRRYVSIGTQHSWAVVS
jgi:hypothetical protein